MLLVGINQERANLLLFELQAQLEGNERIIKDFGKQVKLRRLVAGHVARRKTIASSWRSASTNPFAGSKGTATALTLPLWTT